MAIEPIKGFYVHDEVTDTDGVAKYDAKELEGDITELADIRVGANGVTYPNAGDAVRGQTNDLKTENNQQYDLIAELQDEVLGKSYIHLDYQLGRYIENGYSTAHKQNINNVQLLPPGTYDISAISSDYFYSVWLYVSDSQGTRILAEKNAASSNLNVSGNAKVNVRKVSGTPFTQDEIRYIEQNLVFTKYSVHCKYHGLTSGSANNIVEVGFYTIGANVEDVPTVSSVNMEVRQSSADGQWLQQYLFNVINGNAIYWRNGRNQSGVHSNNGDGLSVTWGEWKKVLTEDALVSIQPNRGQTIVCLGDSIFGNTRDTTSIPSKIAAISGATVYNFCLGGTKASPHHGDSTSEAWGYFDFTALAAAIANNDFTNQIANLNTSGMPSYFSDVITSLQSIDFTKVDIVTINYGGNDYTSGDYIKNTSNKYDTSTYLGALRTGIETLLNAFPNLRILLVTPPYKFFMVDGEFSNDSDTKTFNDKDETLHDFAKSLSILQNEYHFPLSNLYDDLGINRYNRSTWFINGDGSHPNESGREMTAKLVCGTLQSM